MKFTFKRLLVLCFALIFLGACATGELRQYGNFDPTEKTITVPAGGGFYADIKDIFKRNGWKIVVDKGSDVMEGNIGTRFRIESHDSYKTRYRMAMEYRSSGYCVGYMEPLYKFNISVIDNGTGEEIFVLDGRSCSSIALEQIESALKK